MNKDLTYLGLIPYTGNKQKLLPQLVELFPEPNSYTDFVDMFCGGLSVSLTMAELYSKLGLEKKIYANDSCLPLMNMYKELCKMQDTPSELVQSVLWPFVKEDDQSPSESYYRLREAYNTSMGIPIQQPYRLYTLILHSFSNLYRVNDKGEFNVPYGDRGLNKQSVKRFGHFKKFCDKLTFSCKDFGSVYIPDSTFIYLDPPYFIGDATYNKGWDIESELFMYDLLDHLNDRGIKWGLSNMTEHKGKSNDILKQWMNKYSVKELKADYILDRKLGVDKGTKEVYIYNY